MSLYGNSVVPSIYCDGTDVMFRKTLVIGDFTLYGWRSLFSMPKYVDDGMVAVLCAVILFMVPTKKNDGMILESSDLKGIP